jgi:hypothetical protein
VKELEMKRDAAENVFTLVKEITEDIVIQQNPERQSNVDKATFPLYNCPASIVAERIIKGRKITKKINVVRGANMRVDGRWSTAGVYILPVLISRA